VIIESFGNHYRSNDIAIQSDTARIIRIIHSINSHLPSLNPVAIATDHPTFTDLTGLVATKDWICVDGASPPAADHRGVIVLQLPGIVGKYSNKNPV
jgi:hypothetical protein